MRMSRLVYLSLVMLLSMLVLPMATAAQSNPGGNSENAAKCENGGYANYDSGGGVPFKNAGQCTRYAAQGGTLVPVTPDLSISGGLDGYTGSVLGTGFTPTSTIVILTASFSPNALFEEESLLGFPVVTDGNGAFTASGWKGLWFCYSSIHTEVTITAEDAAGVRYSESFPLNCS